MSWMAETMFQSKKYRQIQGYVECKMILSRARDNLLGSTFSQLLLLLGGSLLELGCHFGKVHNYFFSVLRLTGTRLSSVMKYRQRFWCKNIYMSYKRENNCMKGREIAPLQTDGIISATTVKRHFSIKI